MIDALTRYPPADQCEDCREPLPRDSFCICPPCTMATVEGAVWDAEAGSEPAYKYTTETRGCVEESSAIADFVVRKSRLHWKLDGSVRVTIHWPSGDEVVYWSAPMPHGVSNV